MIGLLGVLPLLSALPAAAPAAVPVDLSAYSSASGVEVREENGRLAVAWPVEGGRYGRVAIDLRPGKPLLEHAGIGDGPAGPSAALLEGAQPEFRLTAGSRQAPAGRPPDMSVWNVFFDKPASRPYQTHASRIEARRAKVESAGLRATVTVGDLTIGPFSGELALTFYTGCGLVHVEAVVSTTEDRRAIIYDAGMRADYRPGQSLAWMDTEGRLQEEPLLQPPSGEAPAAEPRALAVRHRAVLLQSDRGTAACFPPPHQFQFPRDLTDNYRFAWTQARDAAGRPGFGVRQDPDGGGAFVPWFNAPPGTRQRLGFFCHLSGSRAAGALQEVLRYTHGDRFPPLPGHLTFTSHYHMAVAVTAMEARKQGKPWQPDFVKVFKDMGVKAVHLAEFHGDGHPRDPGPLRLPEIDAMFEECRRLSDSDLLLIPGEEGNDFLGLKEPGKHPGHWMCMFPRPVRWIMQRAEGQPFVETVDGGAPLYRVGSREDMVELLRREKGLAWSAHPRIKASSWTPDIFRKEDFYRADFWLGAAWKAMPGDLSRERLGERGLDLLDDMSNWGDRKQLPGEVDVFKIDHTHELYAHMNVNYLRLATLPSYQDGWAPILDALRAGQFFVTTGEVLIHDFTAGGKQSGETLELGPNDRPELKVTLSWTFPLKFLEVISGDGEKVYRERTDLRETAAFGSRIFNLRPALQGRRWVRFEVWDVAADGAFTQPIWIKVRGG